MGLAKNISKNILAQEYFYDAEEKQKLRFKYVIFAMKKDTLWLT